MVKISADLISRSAQYLNAIKEFQLDLRGKFIFMKDIKSMQ